MSQGCTQPELPPEQVLESQSTGAAKLLDAMGARSCITGYAGGSAGIFPFIQGKFAGGTSIGCEHISIMSARIDQAQRVINCIITKTVQSNTTDGVVMNVANITITDSDIDGLCIDQAATMKVSTQAEFDSQNRSQITSELKSMVESIREQANDDKIGWGAGVVGTKSVQQIDNSLEQLISSTQIDELVQEVSQNYHVQNNLTLKIVRSSLSSLYNTGGGCSITINQTAVLQLESANYISATIDKVVDAFGGTEYTEDWVQQNKLEAEGADVFSPLWDPTSAFVIFGIIIIVIILFIPLVLFGVAKGSGTTLKNLFSMKSPGKIAIVMWVFVVICIIGITIGAINGSATAGIIFGVLLVITLGLAIWLTKRHFDIKRAGGQEQFQAQRETQKTEQQSLRAQPIDHKPGPGYNKSSAISQQNMRVRPSSIYKKL